MNVIAVGGISNNRFRHALAALQAIVAGSSAVCSDEFAMRPPDQTAIETYPERKPRKAHLSKWHGINKAMGGVA